MAKQPKSWPHKIRPVRIAEMRTPPVGIAQRRFSRSQAEQYAANFDENKLGVPAINHRNSIYWVVDGQHRIEALKLFFAPSDPGAIECSVYVDLTDSEMAELFIGLNTRRTVNRFDAFNIACSAERTRESDILRIVEANGLKVKQAKDANCVGAVSALCQIADRSGTTVLGQTLRALRDGLSGDALAFDAYLMLGVANVFNRYNGRANERHLATALALVQRGSTTILRRAEAAHEKTGNVKAQCVAAAIVDIYNKSLGQRSKDRLPPWWKEAAGSGER